MPTSTHWEPANSPKISEKTACTAGAMWASTPTRWLLSVSYTHLDKLSAYLKCVEELKAGNTEFTQAEKQTYKALVDIDVYKRQACRWTGR